MSRRVTIIVGSLFALLLVLPISGARFTDTTANRGSSLSSLGTTQPIRSTTYKITCESNECSFSLNQPLAKDYFVLLRGSAGGVDAAADYVRVVPASFDSEDALNPSEGPTSLKLVRWSSERAWNGDATVIESLGLQDTAGFRLVDTAVIDMAKKRKMAQASGSWTDESQVGLYGGSMGGGMTVQPIDGEEPVGHASGWARIWPEDGQIRLRRTIAETSGKFTVFAVEWGSEWTIQHVRVQGHNGGEGVGSTGAYNTSPLATSVTREQTFVLAYGSTHETTAGTGWEAQIYTLGDGEHANSTESQVAVGGEYGEKRDAEVYVHTHPRLHVDYEFGSMITGQGFGSVSVEGPSGPETYNDATHSTGPLRFPIFSNSYRQDTTDAPQSIAWARHKPAATVMWARSDATGAGAYWLQSVDFGEIWR